MPSARIKLGTERGFMLNRTLFLGPDAVEIDEAEGYNVFVRRVLFSDVELITLHGFLSWRAFFLLAMWGLVGLPFLFAAEGAVRVVGLLGCALAVVPIVVYLRRGGTHVVTVFGRRSRARILFPLRPSRARDTYRRLVEAVGRSQAPSPRPLGEI